MFSPFFSFFPEHNVREIEKRRVFLFFPTVPLFPLVSVRGERDWGFVRSRLYVARARPSDSGRYSCCYTNTTCDSVTVHVIAGEYPAAMQHDTTPEATPSSISPSPHPRYLHLRVVIGFLTCVFSWRAT
ncbi:hypothetical protein E2C01_029340 [Portunus trituberculatus]|uniref:Ig-like domain-containing protein n=1 Tax=Portunus trituberculatus TaxID=210409 RepID=A0A5B7ESN0_PORTR|nr:hypothetical protein [Portunus trituberculatus]